MHRIYFLLLFSLQADTLHLKIIIKELFYISSMLRESRYEYLIYSNVYTGTAVILTVLYNIAIELNTITGLLLYKLQSR